MTYYSLQNNFSKKIFPFSPGIVWTLKNGKYIQPKIDCNALDKFISNNPIYVICYGLLFESFFSISILELLHKKGYRKLYWIGNKEFEKIIYWNGLSKFSSLLEKKDLNKFTTPFFKDLDNNVYCNSLLNYRNVNTYYNYPGYHDHSPVMKQIFKNSTFSWNDSYIPKIRISLNDKFKKQSKVIIIFPDKLNFCNKNIDCLEISNFQINALCTMLSQHNFEIIIISDNYFIPNKNVKFVKASLENIFFYLSIADYILSKNIDLLLLALCISKAKIIYSFSSIKKSIREFILDSNYYFLYNAYSTKNNIVKLDDLTVNNIYSNIVEL